MRSAAVRAVPGAQAGSTSREHGRTQQRAAGRAAGRRGSRGWGEEVHPEVTSLPRWSSRDASGVVETGVRTQRSRAAVPGSGGQAGGARPAGSGVRPAGPGRRGQEPRGRAQTPGAMAFDMSNLKCP